MIQIIIKIKKKRVINNKRIIILKSITDLIFQDILIKNWDDFLWTTIHIV